MYIPFPDESGFARSADGTEPIRGGSVGFNNILGLFVKTAQKVTRPLTGGFVINGLTVFRNVFHPDDTMKTIVPKWEKDIHLFVSYFQSYLSYVNRGNAPKAPTPVIIYLPDYKKIPPLNRRVHTGNTAAMMTLYAAFLKEYSHPAEPVFTNPFIDQWLIPVGGSSQLPHQDLNKWLDWYITKHDSSLKADRRLLMISHLLIDFHMAIRKPSLQVLESYTAEIIPPPDFRFKLDKSGVLPFNAVTHLVFGDKTLIAPQIKPHMAKMLRERATTERWMTKAPSSVKDAIQKATNLPNTVWSLSLS